MQCVRNTLGMNKLPVSPLASNLGAEKGPHIIHTAHRQEKFVAGHIMESHSCMYLHGHYFFLRNLLMTYDKFPSDDAQTGEGGGGGGGGVLAGCRSLAMVGEGLLLFTQICCSSTDMQLNLVFCLHDPS